MTNNYASHRTSLSQFQKKMEEKLEKITKYQAEEIGRRAVEITRQAMLSKKNGNIVHYNTWREFKKLQGQRQSGRIIGRTYRRSALGEVIGKEPDAVKSKQRRNELSSYDALEHKTFRKHIGGNYSYETVVSDYSPRSDYKSEYIKGQSKNYSVGKFGEYNIWKNRNSDGTLRNGRTSIGYGLYNAVQEFIDKGLSTRSKEELKKW